MSRLFVDTSGWGHLTDPRQQFAEKAATLYREARAGRGVVTTNHVIAELTALLINPLRIKGPKRIEILEGIRTSSYIDVVNIDERMEAEAWHLLRNRPDKDWTLVDCSSFVLMRELDITYALTTDHHFEQAGFICLLK